MRNRKFQIHFKSTGIILTLWYVTLAQYPDSLLLVIGYTYLSVDSKYFSKSAFAVF